MNTPRKLVPPTTPKSKTILKTGVWGHIVGLKKLDESVYYRYPIDKSYCSFGRSDSNDIRVQIDAVSELHCKLIRRDDGEVWLKDTSTNGTLLNNVLVHDTARPIQHNDVMTIAGRKFRFESVEPVPRPPLQSAGISTPGRMVSNIQKTIDDDIQILAEIPSPTAGRLLLTPKKDTARSAAALESSLGLFTPNRAAKLSSLLVSPKPVPMPAFLAKSPKRMTTTPRKVLTMIDEPSVLNPTCTAVPPQAPTSEIEPGMQTPPQNKRKTPMDFDEGYVERTPKKVSFGPALSPEIFDKAEPPSTPMKRGQQQGILTPRKQGVSTPSLLSKLSALKPTTKPILTPSKLSRTSALHDMQKPAPLNLFAPDDTTEELEAIRMPLLTPSRQNRTTPIHGLQKLTPLGQLINEKMAGPVQKIQPINIQEAPGDSNATTELQDDKNKRRSEVLEEQPEPTEDSGSSSDNSNESSDDGLWNKLIPIPDAGDAGSAVSNILDENQQIISLDDLSDDDDGPPSTPTRGPMGRIATPLLSTPTRPRRLSDDLLQQEHTHHVIKLSSPPLLRPSDGENTNVRDIQSHRRSPSPPIVVNNPMYSGDVNPFEEHSTSSEVRLELSPSSFSTPPRLDADTVDTTPVYTPVRRQASSEHQQQDVTPFKTTPNSASRLALLQLSAQKIRGLPDLLQSPGSPPPLSTPIRPTMTLPLFDQFDDEELGANRGESDVQETNDGINTSESAVATNKSDEQTKTASLMDAKRRSSAPAAVDRSQSPIFSGIRGVFRTPQKVVESCFAGIAGIRNFMSPTRLASQQSSSRPSAVTELADNERTDGGSNIDKSGSFTGTSEEPGVENLDVRETVESVDEKEILLAKVSDSATALQRTPTKPTASGSTTTTPKRRIASHQDVMAILLGHPKEPSPKSKEFSFAKEPSVLTPSKSLDQIKARGRRSDILPQKRTIANRSQSQSAEDRVGAKGEQEIIKDSNGVIRRRRTISLFEFKGEVSYSSSAAPFVISRSENAPALESKEGVESLHSAGKEGEEDAEQAELLRLLGEGAESANEEEDAQGCENDDNKENIDYDAIDDASADPLLHGGDEVGLDEQNQKPPSEPKSPSRRTSLSPYNRSRESTPTKRRHSFKKRLGSASPAFRRYEQQNAELEEDEEDEDDMVVMISPKRVRTKYAPHNKPKLAAGTEEPVSMKEKVEKELELAKLRKQVVIDKPKKTIKKKPMSTKAKIRREKTLERGLMNSEKDEKRIDKYAEKVVRKKRGKQMWD
ncbi:antigen identified by monoclonal antibody Ki-67 [Entomortierella chlamydospora]|nr:antigen identified by monoclonal antibody Ki-67 [Entomortierella chlamydospora]